MTKEFKNWDSKFTADDVKKERGEWLGSLMGRKIMTRVPFAAEIRVWSNSAIAAAVYHAPDAEDWQRFRVAMKGLDTWDKLMMLCARRHYMNHEWIISGITAEQWEHEQCRADNYVGALRRGGFLNEKYEVVK